MNHAIGTEDQQVADAVAQYFADPQCGISDRQARMIASRWHGGQNTAMYSFVSCGALGDAFDGEMAVERSTGWSDAREYFELHALWAYAVREGHRGAQAGWSQLTW